MSAGCGTQGKATLLAGAQSVSGVATASRISIQSGSTQREFIIDIPASYDNTHPYRLVFSYHWVGANDTIIATGNGYCNDPGGVATLAGEYYGLKALDTASSTIFVAPNGIGGSWSNSGQSDVAFTQAMVDEIEKDLCIDTTRVFSMGFSFGASMTYTLACAKPNVFRGVAILDGSNVISNPPSPCNQPIAYFQVHGINDGDFNIVTTAEVMRDKFVMNNGCTPQTVANVANGSHTHSCTTYQGCSAGHPLEWCSFDGIHQACEYDGASGDSVQKSWVPAEAWKFFTQF
jgi:poly(3-hydroxybutyrate) depolymerase